MDWQQYIEQRPGVMLGKPVIKGTRITVEHILERLGAGWTEEQVLQSYPHLRAIMLGLMYTPTSQRSDAAKPSTFIRK